jgi:hypothetical protein
VDHDLLGDAPHDRPTAPRPDRRPIARQVAERGRPGDDQPLRAHWDPTAEDPRGRRGPRPERRKRTRIGAFVATYGWRAYALPVLAILTVVLVAVTLTGTSSSPTPAAPAPDAASRNTDVNSETSPIGAPTGNAAAATLPAGQLPDGGSFTTNGAKSWRVVPGTTGAVGTAPRVYTYTVEVENGLAPADYGSDAIFAKLVDTTLANPKSWIGGGKVSFRRIETGTPDFRVSLTSTGTTRELCGYQIKLESSCYYPPEARVTLNEARWVRGAVSYQGDDLLYRQYAINHEIGHAIGFEKHQPCGQEGALAPVMMQQSFGVANSDIMAIDPDMQADRDLVCRANPWPFPGS